MNLTDIFDPALLGQMVDAGMVRLQAHPRLPLRIANYTEQAVFERCWNDVTLNCRGLIYNTDLEVVARPFGKFFNLGEPDTHIPDGPFRVTEKVDGSLGILYPDPTQPTGYAVATRGSFTSEQAEHATKLLQTKYDGLEPVAGYTYLFEIVFPANRIVVDYGDLDDLVLLDVIDNRSGFSVFDATQQSAWWQWGWTGPVVEAFEPRTIEELVAEDRHNHEGYVLYWPEENYRLKVKHETYKYMHRIVTNCTKRTVWEYLSEGRDIDELITGVPDEFRHWVEETSDELTTAACNIQQTCDYRFKKIMDERSLWEQFDREGKKRFALQVASDGIQQPYRAVLFCMWDDQPYNDIIWKSLKPEAEKPFWQREI